MQVLMISPGFPAEMPFFTRGLSRAGATVVGIGDQPASMLPDMVKPHLAHYLQVPRIWDEQVTLGAVRELAERVRIDRVECLWEPGMLLAAAIRESLGVAGMTVAQTLPFRDKEAMKRALDAAGIRTPRHARAATVEEVHEAAERIGYPLIVKPIAGAGSADTHRVDSPRDLERVQAAVRHVPEVSVEEFIEGEEYTYDTITAGGEALYENVSWYRPKPLIGRTLEWVSPQTVCLRNLDRPEPRTGIDFGRRVMKTLGFDAGFSHMEWFLKPDGEPVFGEIAARPPGAKSVDVMNYAGDVDLFLGWGEAMVGGALTQPTRRIYNAIVIFKRAQGRGRISRIEGLEHLMALYGDRLLGVDLLPVGAHRRDWKATLLSDGWLFLRHPHLETALEIADRVGTDLRIYAEA